MLVFGKNIINISFTGCKIVFNGVGFKGLIALSKHRSPLLFSGGIDHTVGGNNVFVKVNIYYGGFKVDVFILYFGIAIQMNLFADNILNN